ncbi:MAG: hypothetical protein AAF907_05470 [Planctomycetota bacterium]
MSSPARFAVLCRSPGVRAIGGATLLAAALRAFAAWYWADEVATDVDMYRGLAANVLAGEGYVSPETGVATAFRPPLVPLIYAALGDLDWAILLFQVLAGAATAGVTVRLGRALGLTWLGAALAGVIVACDPVLLRYTPRPMTEITAALLTALLLWRIAAGGSWKNAALIGLLFGLSGLCRPTIWAFGGLWTLAWAWDRLRGRAGWLHGWKRLAAGAAATLLAVSPWVVRNQLVFDRPILMTTHGGYTLHLANNEVFYEEVARGPVGAVWDGRSLLRWQIHYELSYFNWRGLDSPRERRPDYEVDEDEWRRELAVDAIQSDPAGFVRAVPLRISRLWSPVPIGPAAEGTPGPLRWTVGGWNVGVFLLMAWGAVRVWKSDRWTGWRAALLLLASLTAVHAVYWSNARMRGAVVPAIAVLAAAGACGVGRETPGPADGTLDESAG